MTHDYSKFTREQLVEHYCSVKLAGIINHIGTDWHRMPTDVNQDPAYWKNIDGNLHEMHKEIARRYHISRDECLWLENMVDSTNLYVFDRQFKRIVHETILSLEEEEEKKLKAQSRSVT